MNTTTAGPQLGAHFLPAPPLLRRKLELLLALAICLLWAGGAKADLAATNATVDPGELSLEQLINLQVTSVSKKETSLNQSPAAIYVITPEDIRRLGIETLPDALRLAPGMDVAQINSHEWGVTARGFNTLFANKLLVMVDGRSIYEPAFGGVVWGVQDVVMEDLDRIEVIRGPGGTLWGANAVNGVINIISKSAKDTQGGLVSTTVGTEDRPVTTVRYGGLLATNLYYRAYLKYYDRDEAVTTDGRDAPDDARDLQGGFRMDWELSDANKLTLQGDYYAARFVENQDIPSLLPPYSLNPDAVNHDSGGNVLGRWTRTFSESSSLTLQTYYDHVNIEQMLAADRTDTIDVDAQHRFSLGDRNDVVWGIGYRHLADKMTPSFFVSWNPEHEEQLYSAFAQDEITLVPDRLKFTLGSKVEHNDFTGFEFEPSARLLWTPTDNQTVWAAVSRAVRTPAFFDHDGQANLEVMPPSLADPFPVLVSSFGNPNLKSEDLIAYELGYRIEPAKRCSLDATLFYNDYDNLIVPVAGPMGFEASPVPHVVIPTYDQNVGAGQTYGVELSARWNVTENWHLTAGYSWLRTQMEMANPILKNSPEQQVQLRSTLDLPGHLEFNGAVYYVGPSTSPYGLGQADIPSYVRLDLGLVWHPTRSLEIGIWGQNLIDERHVEFTSYKTSQITEIPRSFLAKVTWRF